MSVSLALDRLRVNVELIGSYNMYERETSLWSHEHIMYISYNHLPGISAASIQANNQRA